jgi:nicotinamidase-related amidase
VKSRGGPCIYANDNFGDWISEFSTLTRECLQREGASGSIARALQPGTGDLSVLKPRHSAFFGTPLEFLLDELGTTRLIVAGITIDNCVFATAQDAHVRKFDLWIPADCSAGFCAAHERASLAHMARTLKADTRPAGIIRGTTSN